MIRMPWFTMILMVLSLSAQAEVIRTESLSGRYTETETRVATSALIEGSAAKFPGKSYCNVTIQKFSAVPGQPEYGPSRTFYIRFQKLDDSAIVEEIRISLSDAKLPLKNGDQIEVDYGDGYFTYDDGVFEGSIVFKDAPGDGLFGMKTTETVRFEGMTPDLEHFDRVVAETRERILLTPITPWKSVADCRF